MTLTAEQRSARARAAAYAQHAKHDPRETTKKAREALALKFHKNIPPDLSEEEHQELVKNAKREFYSSIGIKGSINRRRQQRHIPPFQARIGGWKLRGDVELMLREVLKQQGRETDQWGDCCIYCQTHGEVTHYGEPLNHDADCLIKRIERLLNG